MAALRTIDLLHLLAQQTRMGWWKTALRLAHAACAGVLLCAATATVAAGQSFQSLLSFDQSDGGYPEAPLIQGANGNFYGTGNVEPAGGGTVFEITPAGSLTTLYNFFCTQLSCAGGGGLVGGVIQATNGNFYGTTASGGASGYAGTVFEITPAGSLTTLYNFCSQPDCTDGDEPEAGLVQAANGNFYGTTYQGGANGFGGTVFEVTPEGSLTTLYSFCSSRVILMGQTNCTDGELPEAGLIQATNGNFYGTTASGGANGFGTVFEITPAGNLTTLYSFCSQTSCADGSAPVAGLVQAANGNFYGTTEYYGANRGGTVFEITSEGSLTTLYSFCRRTKCRDGEEPTGGLVQASDGNFYGTTYYGGANGGCYGDEGCGTVFQITPEGSLTTLYSFCSQTNCADGEFPQAGLIQATNGSLYGTTLDGGWPADAGTVFSESVGLGPFVKTIPAFGRVGERVTVLGNDLTGTTSVTFNGMAASFGVNATGTALRTTVPDGATTGYVQVTTPSGTLTSNVRFRVLP